MSFRLNPGEDRKIAEAVIMDNIARNQRDERAFSYHYPRNAEEWWKNVDTWWPELLNLIHLYNTRLGDLPPLETGIMEPAAVALERMRAARDIELERILSTTWMMAPDHGSIHANKGWDVLCDLCSESYVLQPEPPEEAQ